MDYPNCPGGGKRGGPASRKSVQKSPIQDDDQESHSSGSTTNCFGFVAYSVNSGEKQRVKIQTLGQQQPASSYSPRSDDCDRAPAPVPRKLRCLEQLQPEPPTPERRERPCKRRRSKEPLNDTVDLRWLG